MGTQQTVKNLPSNAGKGPDDRTTGGQTMTGAPASYRKTLCAEAGEAFDPALQQATGRGRDH
jgi:hypothetical protein